MSKQGFNPYLPSWEYIPDGEPYVFNNRVYIFGSHDKFNGDYFCLNDYVCWSAPVDNLADWRYEGVIYKKTDDPKNSDAGMSLFAPDVAQGPDNRYYLFYALDRQAAVSVAVCDTPAGKYEFYGNVRYPDGTLLGEKTGDQLPFDPGVLVEGNNVYLYTGFCPKGRKDKTGSMVTELEADMLTIKTPPTTLLPSEAYSAGTGYEGHEFFEASSIRKIDETYYLIYSSVNYHELCYATSKYPAKDFTYRGTIISNNDSYIDSYKPAAKTMYYGGNNHGSIVEIKNKWYVFYHRHTNGTSFSRQGCIEPIKITEDGTIPQVEMTSCGSNNGPLNGIGEYPAYIACNLFCNDIAQYTADPGKCMDSRYPRITQDGADGEKDAGYIANMRNGATAGFKYFDCKEVRKISIKVRGNCTGSNNAFEVMTSWNGTPLGKIPINASDKWTSYSADIQVPDGINALYFRYVGDGCVSLASFSLFC